MKFSRAGKILLMAILPLLVQELTACSLFVTKPIVTLQGNNAVKLQQGESAPFSGWELQPEALARILEKAEACSAGK